MIYEARQGEIVIFFAVDIIGCHTIKNEVGLEVNEYEFLVSANAKVPGYDDYSDRLIWESLWFKDSDIKKLGGKRFNPGWADHLYVFSHRYGTEIVKGLLKFIFPYWDEDTIRKALGI